MGEIIRSELASDSGGGADDSGRGSETLVDSFIANTDSNYVCPVAVHRRNECAGFAGCFAEIVNSEEEFKLAPR